MLGSMRGENGAKAVARSFPLLPISAAGATLPYLVLGVLGSSAYVVFPAPAYLAIHNIVELGSVVVAFSIFGIGWFARTPANGTGTLILATTFATVGGLDLFHALSFPGMPAFFTPSNTNKGILFWEAARLTSATGLAAIAFIPREAPAIKKARWIAGPVIIVFFCAVSVAILRFEPFLPPMFVEGSGLTLLKKSLEYLAIVIFVIALLGLARRPVGDEDESGTILLSAIILSIASEFSFTLYRSAYDSYNLLGHLFKLASYLLLYRATFMVAVSAPYMRFGESREDLRRENEARQKSEESLAKINRELAVIHEINRGIVRIENEQNLLDEACRILCASGGYKMAWVGYALSDEGKSVKPISSAGDVAGYLDSLAISWGDGPSGMGPTGMAIRTGTRRYVQNFESDPAMRPWLDQAIPRGYRSSIALPLKTKSETLGALTVYAGIAEAFTPAEISLLEELADDLAFGIGALRARVRNQAAEDEIRDALREKEVLLRELHHRTRNSMQVISSMISLEEDRLSTEADRRIFESVVMRIQAMALVHQRLYQGGDLSKIDLKGYIRSLCELVRESGEGHGEAVAFDFSDMDEVDVLIDTAVPLGLVLNELLSNTFNHAFPEGRQGLLRISLHRGKDSLVHLGFADDGVGFDGGHNPRSLGKTGFMLIFDIVTLQLGGKAECTTGGGTSWSISFPENRYEARV